MVPNKQAVIFCETTLLGDSSSSYVHFKALVSRLNRPEVRFHDIRHVYAALIMQSEIGFKTLSRSFGHATVAFTLDAYGHVSNRMFQNAAVKIENSFARRKKNAGLRTAVFVGTEKKALVGTAWVYGSAKIR